VIALLALLGGGCALGVVLVLSSFDQKSSAVTHQSVMQRLPTDYRHRLARAAAGAMILGLPTRWPVAFIGGGLIGWYVMDVFGGEANRRRNIDRTEAIASWTEMLRDTIGSAHGLEETIIASARVAPEPIAAEVIHLATRLEHQPLDESLRQFADELSHPTGDLVVAALLLAAHGSTRDLGQLLGTLAVAARDEAGMHLRIDAARARMRTAIRVIALSTVATAVVLALINRSYLNVYGDTSGQLMLILISAIWGASLYWLNGMSRFEQPERFFAAKVTP
jgi:tight adherence protein B